MKNFVGLEVIFGTQRVSTTEVGVFSNGGTDKRE